MSRLLRALWPLITLLVLVGFFTIGLTRDPSLLPSEMIDRPVPAFELTELYQVDKKLTQDIFIGDVTLINVFGSWCVACRVEHPKLMQLSKSGEVKLIGIDWRDSCLLYTSPSPRDRG